MEKSGKKSAAIYHEPSFGRHESGYKKKNFPWEKKYIDRKNTKHKKPSYQIDSHNGLNDFNG